MVDVQERKKMMEAILSLLANPQQWDVFDEYYSHLNTQDAAVYDIGWFFWVCLDPEYPSNSNSLSDSSSFRAILFLLSTQEYHQRLGNRSLATCGGDEYWPFPGRVFYGRFRV
jgi:hypothetical protein